MQKLFDIKRTLEDGSIDLSDKVLQTDEFETTGIITLKENERARIDKISYRQYGHYNMIDSLMYANSIINPFSISQNQVMLLPVDSDEDHYSKNTDVVFKEKSNPSITDYNYDDKSEQKEFIEKTKLANNKLKSTTDTNRQKRLQALQDKFVQGSNTDATSLVKRDTIEMAEIKNNNNVTVDLNKQ